MTREYSGESLRIDIEGTDGTRRLIEGTVNSRDDLRSAWANINHLQTARQITRTNADAARAFITRSFDYGFTQYMADHTDHAQNSLPEKLIDDLRDPPEYKNAA